MPDATILTQPVKELPVSTELSAFMRQHQMLCLQTLLKHPSNKLLEMEGFSYHCLVELYRLLRAHGCEDHLREA